jgi:LCP family protein required for cell wall assembly
MSAVSSKKPNQLLGNIAYGFFLAGALAVGSVYGWAGRSNIIGPIIRNPLGFMNTDPRIAFDGKNSETLLILGCDEDRFYRGVKLHGQNIYKKFARSDMMLIAKLNFDTNTITGLSIPRDTSCRIPQFDGKRVLGGTHKINAFHELAPPKEADEVTKLAVAQILPTIHIDKVVDLDFDAIQKLVDIVGGVQINVPKEMNYDDNAGELHIHLHPGEQKLNGYNAMCFVRFRHDRESDFGRQQRQKDFLTAFKSSALRNPLALPELAEQGKACLNYALDDNELLALAAFARKVPSQQIKMGMVPVKEGPGTKLVVDQKLLPARLAEFGFSDRPASTNEASTTPSRATGSSNRAATR